MASKMNVEFQAIPSFDEIRTKLVPLIKTDIWAKSIKDLLQRTDGATHSVFFKPLNNKCRMDLGFTVAIKENNEYKYVLNTYLAEWHISSTTLLQIAQANLSKLIKEENVWQTSETGIYFVQCLGCLSPSVILLPDVIRSLAVKDGDPVAIIPASDLFMVGSSQNVKQLCVMGEISLRFSKKENFLSAQPLRFADKEWKIFEANKANDEHPFPRSADEVKMLKRALKMQGEI